MTKLRYKLDLLSEIKYVTPTDLKIGPAWMEGGSFTLKKSLEFDNFDVNRGNNV